MAQAARESTYSFRPRYHVHADLTGITMTGACDHIAVRE